MICINCENEEFEERDCFFGPEINGEKVYVSAPAMVCTKCMEKYMTPDQMDYLRNKAKEAYDYRTACKM